MISGKQPLGRLCSETKYVGPPRWTHMNESRSYSGYWPRLTLIGAMC